MTLARPAAGAALCLTLAARSAALVAQTLSATPVPMPVEPVVVTATRSAQNAFEVPASIDVIGADAIGDAHLEINLSESSTEVPGLTVRARQNFAQDEQLSIRGFGARTPFGVTGVRVYVDGIPATLPDGEGQVSNIDLGSVARIEVLRGPFSALYGNASGGVIQAFTATASGPPTVVASLAGGSYGELREGLKFSAALDAFGAVVDASHFEVDGYREHSAAERFLLNAKLSYAPDGDSSVTLVVNSVTQPRALDPMGLTRAELAADPRGVDPTALLFNTRKTFDQTQAGVLYGRRLSDADALNITVYHGQRDIEQFQAIPVATQMNPSSPGGVIVLGRTYEGIDARLSHTGEWLAGAYDLSAGVSLDTLDEARRGYDNFSGDVLGVAGALRRFIENHVMDVDPYLQSSWSVASGWTVSAGVRRSDVQFRSVDNDVRAGFASGSGGADYAATLPVAALEFAPTDALRLYATAGRGFETPTLDQLAYRPDGAPGLNYALEPSTSRTGEIGAKWHEAPLGDVRVALFETRTRDEIVTATSTGGRSVYQNAGATERAGIELLIDHPWSAAWQSLLSFTDLDAYYSSSFLECATVPCPTPSVLVPAGRRLPGVARSNLAATLAWHAPDGWRASLEGRLVSRVDANDVNSALAPGYGMVSVSIGYATRWAGVPIEGFARLDNLFDRHVVGSVIVNDSNGRYFEPAPGRSISSGLSVAFS